MLVSFIGSFNSGKTTVGAKVFASLKDRGYIAEYIPEVARIFIAKRRVENNLAPNYALSLSNEDQEEIFKLQLEAEELMVKACGEDVIVVTDSSVYNSLLYMDPGYLVTGEVVDLLIKAKSFYDSINYKVFICNPINNVSPLKSDQALAPGQNPNPLVPLRPLPLDPNRVHGPELAKAIEARVESYFGAGQAIRLSGDSDSRAMTVMMDILESI